MNESVPAQVAPSTDPHAATAERQPSRDALAALMFPHAWAIATSRTGAWARRQRHNLRRAAETEVQMEALRKQDASCGSCKYLTGGVGGIKGPICDAHSDFDGYAITTLDGLCVDWASRRTTHAVPASAAANTDSPELSN